MALENTSQGSRKLFRRLSQLADKGSDFQKHPINVASLAVLITSGICYSKEQILTDVAMAAVLHDVGLSKIPAKIISHSHDVLKLSIEDRQWVYKHPQLAIEIIEEKKIPVSDLTKTLILQHHEEFKGTGYPNGLRGYMINELAQIVRIADDLDQLFGEFQPNAGHLRTQVAELLKRHRDLKIIEPLLLSRIQQVLI
jgi:HD-GYP domain-containing protein (c-di-GMP phosphodiesterase class II)